jgi:hypothetical protein
MTHSNNNACENHTMGTMMIMKDKASVLKGLA